MSQEIKREPLTNSELWFNAFRIHVVEGKPKGWAGVCRYRTKESACAIGGSIPDELYHSSLDYGPVPIIAYDLISQISMDLDVNKYPYIDELKDYFANISIEFATCMQRTHDQSDRDLTHIARDYYRVYNSFKDKLDLSPIPKSWLEYYL